MLAEMTDVGDSVERVEVLLEELTAFQISCDVCIYYYTLFVQNTISPWLHYYCVPTSHNKPI